MKKIFFSLLLAFAIFFVNVDNTEAQPPCDIGWTNSEITIDVNGCIYKVNICYKCSVLSNDFTEVKIHNYWQINPTCIPNPPLSATQIFNILISRVRDNVYKLNLCTPRPCDEDPPMKMLISLYSCWKADISTGNLLYLPCTNSGRCDYISEGCIRNGVYEWTISTWTYYAGDLECEVMGSGGYVIPPGSTSSPCYKMPTPCDN